MKHLIILALLLTACAPNRFESNKGDQGVPGTPSKPCTVIKYVGYSEIMCPDGTKARVEDGAIGGVGSPGHDGDKGDKGDQGNVGTPGTPGTVVTMVSLCPGVTVYPSAFVEIAMCINNNLYGVYSANGGFLTYFPPGNYSSNAIGSACNLTIQANCVVSH